MRTSLILITLYSACGDQVGSTSTYDDYAKSAVELLCPYYTRCGSYSKSREAACASVFGSSHATLFSVDDEIAAGRVKYDPDAAKTCLDSISTLGCDLGSLLAISQSALCGAILKPNVPAGGTCKTGIECVNSFCQQSSPYCDGTCVAYVATGSDCGTATMHCAPGDTCDSTTQKCVPRSPSGAACTSSETCTKGLSCTGGTCQSPGGVGAACQSLFDCQVGLYCDTTAKKCAARQPAGSACSSSGSCGDGLTCVGDAMQMGSCQPFLDLGQSCTGTNTDSACAGDARCDDITHTCTLYGQEDGDCTSSCGPNLYCNSMKKCVPIAGVGEACDPAATQPCVTGATCDMTTRVCLAPMCK